MNPQKSLNNSFNRLDSSSINKSQLNTSSSKMQYSFPKQHRFSQQKNSSSPNRYYELPSTKMKRATSFGYGNKTDLAKRNFLAPPPDRYNLLSDFQKNKKGITIAPGRSQVKANDMFFRPLKQSPQPATYNPKKLQESLKFSLHPRLQDHTDKWIKSVPGPGAYSYLQLTSKGKSHVAKHYTVTAGRFDQLPRLSQTQMARNKNPGPNQYKNTAQILNQLKYTKKGGNVFTKSARLGIMNKSFAPGPGQYPVFSQFS